MDYKIDALAIAEKENQIVSDMMTVVLENSAQNGGIFIKSNFGNKKISARQNEPYIKKLISSALVHACALAGIKNEIDQLNGSDIQKLIMNKFSSLTVEEISKAFEMERHLEFGEKSDHFQLFNAEYVATVLKKYIDWKRQTMHQQNIQLPSASKTTGMSQEEIRTVKIAGILDCYEDFLKLGKVDDFRFNVFDMLYSAGIMPKIDESDKVNERYAKIKKIAQEQLILEIGSKGAISSSKNERESFKQVYLEVKGGFGNALDNRCKAIALGGLFSKLKDKDGLMDLLSKNIEKL